MSPWGVGSAAGRMCSISVFYREFTPNRIRTGSEPDPNRIPIRFDKNSPQFLFAQNILVESNLEGKFVLNFYSLRIL